MEGLVVNLGFWQGRRVFLTGMTGFKGAWTAMLLRFLGAEVSGLSLPPESDNGLFLQADVGRDIDHRIGDIRDLSQLQLALMETKPSIVIHMAAQSLVRRSYVEPIETYATNVMGTINLLEAVRKSPGIDAVIIVTSDKCYENTGLTTYRESAPMGGHDPYSSSKGCAEIVTSAYRRSFFNNGKIATARAGNVIGGGDWACDRLVPDVMRAFIAGEPVRIRKPKAVRPWQHVLDPVLGYLTLAQCLAANRHDFAEGWNFGPNSNSAVPVSELVCKLAEKWSPSAKWEIDSSDHHQHEADYLGLDSSKAQSRLGWRPLIDLDRALQLSVDWYRAQVSGEVMRDVTYRQIESVLQTALQPAPIP